MATFAPFSKSTPSEQRITFISDVSELDQIDLVEVLGRPAKGAKFHMTDAADVITFRLNSLLRLTKFKERQANETVKVWGTGGSEGVVFSATGQTVFQTEPGLTISSIEIVSLTLSTGSTIEITVW